jgi:hypothetical protein
MNIYEAIPAVMGEIGAITKGKKNAQQGFMYRGIDDVMNALQPLLVKYKVAIVPEVIEQRREERTTKSGSGLIYSICTVRYTFFAEDGTSLTAVVVGEGMDSGDKATNKAMSIAFKYACFQVFCIPTEEMIDPDSESHEIGAKPKAPKTEPPKVDGFQEAPLCVSKEQAAELVQLCKEKWGDNAAEAFKTNIGYARCSHVPADKFEEVRKAIANALPF